MSIRHIGTYLHVLLFLISAASSCKAAHDTVHNRHLAQQRDKATITIDATNVEQLSELVSQASKGTTIKVATPSITIEDVLKISANGITLAAADEESLVEIQCSGNGRLEINAHRVTLRNLRIQNCPNGAVSVINSEAMFDPFNLEAEVEFRMMHVKFDRMEFQDNDAGDEEERGGALSVGAGTSVEITNSLFQNNTASTGGAILIDGGGSLDVKNCRFLENRAVLAGGAIAGGISQNFFEKDATLFIRNCFFIGNEDLEGGADNTGLVLSNGAPLENSVFLSFPSPSPSGGAIYIHDFLEVEIAECTFDGNKATPAGGAIYISDNEDVLITNCTFDNNLVISERTRNERSPDLELGGAIYLSFTNVRSGAKIDRCLFRNNSASFGGAIHTVTELATKLTIENCQIENNFADLAAGGLLIRNTIQAKIRNVRFIKNLATSGGGMVITNGAGAFFFKGPSIDIERDIYFIDNSALDGGGLFLLGAGQTVFQNAQFQRNRARRNGGAICLIESLPSGQTTIQESSFSRNGAKRGGAIYADSIARLDIITVDDLIPNKFIQNTALAGGAIHLRPSSQVNNNIRIVSSTFAQNQAVATEAEAEIDNLNLPDVEVETTALGRRLLFHRSLAQKTPIKQNRESVKMQLLDPEALDACNPGGGGALCLLIGQVPERAPIEVFVSDNIFTENEARVGGAMFLATNNDEDWIPVCDSSGSAVESLTAKPCKAMAITKVTFKRNKAQFAGGAIFASNPVSIYFRDGQRGNFQTLDTLSPTDPLFQSNKVGENGFGPNLASNAASLKIVRPDTKPDELLFVGHNSGKELEGGVELILLDVYDQPVTNGIKDSSMAVSINSSIVSGERVASAENGALNFTRVIARGKPRVHLLRFEPNSLITRAIKRQFSIRQCVPGEFRIDDQNICDECRREYFGFNYTYNCDGCPDHAVCPGGATLVPVNGYWHSTPFSPIMHECILDDACSYKGRKEELGKFFQDQHQLEVSNATLTNEEYPQCAEGYEGVLCGSCVDGYGHIVDGECVKCKNLWLTALLISIVCVWTLFLLISTARQAFDTIREMTDMRMIRVLAISERQTLRSELRITSTAQIQDNSNGSESFAGRKFESRSGDENIDHIMAAEKVAEIIKILTNFLQITAIGVGINASWTESVTILLVVEDSISSISSGASFAPMECLIRDLEDRSLIGIVLRSLFPLILTGVYVLANVWKSRSDPKSLKRRVIIGLIVGVFFAYDTVSEMLMRIVNCISLDDIQKDDCSIPNVIQRYGMYSTARKSYWAEDTRHVCWKGTHGIVAGVLGIPGFIIFIFGLPFALALFLMYKRKQEVILEPEFLNTYGFVFQSYRVRFVFWESIVMLRKATMAAVIVFAYDLGPNLQSAVALGILIFALLAQFLAQPFKYKSLNVLESLSLLVSIFVFYAGIIFKDPNTSYGGKVVLSIVILCTNATVISIFLHRLFNAYDHLIIVKLKLEKSEIPPTTFQRIKQLSLIQAEKMKEKITVSTTRRPSPPPEQLPDGSNPSQV